MAKIEKQVTREQVRALAADGAADPDTVAEIVHPGFNTDQDSGGYAFLCDSGLMIYGFGGGNMWSVDPGDEARRLDKIEWYWRESQRRNRPLGLGDVSQWHRAAIAALATGLSSVAELPPSARPGVTDTARADYLLVFLQRHIAEKTEASALHALAANDWLLEVPGEHSRAHTCPLCGLPAIGEPWQYVSVCDDCYPKTVCSDGRLVTGYNTSIDGGFEAQHIDDESVCALVTHCGLVWVDERECHMGEAKFGGVFVGVAPAPSE